MSIKINAIFHPSALVLYKSFGRRKKSQTNIKSLSNLDKGAKANYNGWMSPATARKSKKMINCFLLGLEYALTSRIPTFTTLTLPAKQRHDDNFIKRNLLTDGFIKTMKRKFDVKHYFWRAEPQANGNIHFHILADSFIPWQDVRGNWNHLLEKNGYISDYRNNRETFFTNGFKVDQSFTNHPSRKKQYYNYAQKANRAKQPILNFEDWDEKKQKEAYKYGVKTKWRNPNSTDIHALKKVKNIGAYITKYMTKTPDNIQQYRVIKGRIWGASDSLRDLSYYGDFLEERQWIDDVERISDFNPELAIYLEALRQEPSAKFKKVDDIVSLFLLDKGQKMMLKKHAPTIYNDYTKFYETQSKLLYP